MLYLHKSAMRLALKLFRGEPAISGFDWNFSPTAMGRSPGFGSAVSDFRPFQTRSRSGSAPLALNLAGHRNSPDRSTKSTQSGFRPPTACKHRVSGSFSLPSRGPFHRSFTVLCAIGH